MEQQPALVDAGGDISIEEVQRQAAEHTENQQQGERTQLISFKLGAGEYALHIDQIKEVVITPRIARVPQTPDYIMGIANIRGSIIAIMDLERKFGIAHSNGQNAQGHANYTLVLENDEHRIGVLVKEVPNTLSVLVSDIQAGGNLVQFGSGATNYINGIVTLEQRMIMLIDLQNLIQNETMVGQGTAI